MTAIAVIGLTYRVSKKRLLFMGGFWALSLSMYSQCQRCTSCGAVAQVKARREYGCYLIAPNQVGNTYTGHSMVVDPFGPIVVDLAEREGIEIVDIDLNLVTEVREKLPLLTNRRSDVYARYGATTEGS